VGVIVLLLVVGSTIWVGIDASNLGVQRGRLGGGSLDMSTASWVVCCLLLWIVAFPCYLVARGKYQAMSGGNASAWPQAALGAAAYVIPQTGHHPTIGQAAVPPPVAPPQMSADGQWWWNGYQWVPAAPPHQ
jgi:hypothetical protein